MGALSPDAAAPTSATSLVLRLAWAARRYAHLLSAALLKDLLLNVSLPPAVPVQLPFLETTLTLEIVSVCPLSSSLLRCTKETAVYLVPALPPLLRPAHLQPPPPSVAALLPTLSLSLNLHPHSAALARTGLRAPVSILLHGPYGSGKTSAVAFCAHASGAVLLRVSAAQLLRRVATRDGVSVALRHYVAAARTSAPAVLLLDDAQFVFDKGADEAAAALVEALSGLAAEEGVVVVLCCAPGYEAVHGLVGKVVERVVGMHGRMDEGYAVGLACARSGRGREEVEEVVREGRFRTVGDVVRWACGSNGSGGRGRSETKREVAETEGGGEEESASLTERWNEMASQLGGLAEARTVLKRVLLWRRTRRQTFARLGVTPANGVLLSGCPGTGKTALIRQTAAAARFEVIAVDAAMLARGEVGASERLLKATFEKGMKCAPCVIFLDEIDALLATARVGAPHLVRLVAALALLMDGVKGDVVVVGATNRPWVVSSALLRSGRFEHCVKVGLPDKKERREIAAVYGEKMKLGERENRCLQSLAESSLSEGFSGADIAGACRRAAMSALFRESEIEEADIDSAFRGMTPSVKRADAMRLEAWQPP